MNWVDFQMEKGTDLELLHEISDVKTHVQLLNILHRCIRKFAGSWMTLDEYSYRTFSKCVFQMWRMHLCGQLFFQSVIGWAEVILLHTISNQITLVVGLEGTRVKRSLIKFQIQVEAVEQQSRSCLFAVNFRYVVPVARLEYFRALKSISQIFRALKLSCFENFRALEPSNLAERF